MSVPPNLLQLASSLTFQEGVLTALDVEDYTVIIQGYNSRNPLTPEGYRKIIAMIDYVAMNYTNLPAASIDYVNNLSNRYYGATSYMIKALYRYANGYGIFPPDYSALYTLVNIILQNNRLVKANIERYVGVMYDSNLPGADPLPNIERQI